LLHKGWFEHLADGAPTNGLPYDRAGSDIDTTNPEAARWYWDTIRDHFVTKGFDAFWADETEPDLPPNGSYFSIGPGTRYFNVYPLFHTAAVYDGMRRDLKRRALILSRDAYLGAQRNGTIFWSSDIYPTWDTLRRQIPTGLDFTASGVAYWGNDIGGWQYLPREHHPLHPPLIDPSDARDNVGPALLVAPVTEQGATSREVYLPGGADWYNFLTGKRLNGGQRIEVDAPIDTLPLFVRAGSILPLGEPIENAMQPQKLAKVRIYAGADGDFTLYQDDGNSYAYENGVRTLTRLHWDDAGHKFSHTGAAAWSRPESELVEVVHR
jgi:alpha-glucosidase (family GH31 glycosyl hydrolase)